MNTNIERITVLQVNDALRRIERQNKDDANLIRAYIRKLETLLVAYQLQDKKEADA